LVGFNVMTCHVVVAGGGAAHNGAIDRPSQPQQS
jgi:hypothetical protein